MKRTTSARHKAQRARVFFLCVLTFALCATALAQETISRGMPPPETKQQEVSRGVSLGDRHLVIACPLRPPAILKGSGPEYVNNVDAAPPFPVLTPVAIVYPKKAIRKGLEGQAVVAAEVLPDGSVGRTALAKSSGHELLDHAAQDAIKTWKFGTESEKEETVPQYVDIPVTFKLEDHSD